MKDFFHNMKHNHRFIYFVCVSPVFVFMFVAMPLFILFDFFTEDIPRIFGNLWGDIRHCHLNPKIAGQYYAEGGKSFWSVVKWCFGTDEYRKEVDEKIAKAERRRKEWEEEFGS